MNGGGGFGGGGGRRKTGGAPPPARSKERDEDLLLFRDMYKRDKDRVVSLLQPVSDEFEANGSYPLYGMATSSQKKGPGFGFLGESEKNDYDWLKTPPATPLFPSLEMESKNAPELVVQRELPILQPLSRFAGNAEEAAAKAPTATSNNNTAGRPKSPTPRPRFPGRSVTPSGRPSISVPDHKKNIKSAPIIVNPKLNQLNSSTGDLNLNVQKSNPAKTTSQKESHLNFLAANLSKTLQGTSSSTKIKPTSRGVSPQVRSTIPAQFPGFSDETPSNLKTDRSASRGRGATNQKPTLSTTTTTTSVPQKPEYSTRKAISRQSCSPSVTRGRKVAPKQETASEENNSNNNNNVTTPRGGKMLQSGNGGQFFGSRMVDKMMNARKTSVEEREAKPKLTSSLNEGSGFGRLMSKSSLDMAVKHMDVKRDSVHSRPAGVAAGRRSVSTSKNVISKSSGGSYRVQ